MDDRLFTQCLSFVSLPVLFYQLEHLQALVPLYLPRQSVSFSPGNSVIVPATLSLFLPTAEMRDLNSTQKLYLCLTPILNPLIFPPSSSTILLWSPPPLLLLLISLTAACSSWPRCSRVHP